MDSDRPNHPEGSHDQQSGQQPPGAYQPPPPPAPNPYGSQPQQPTQPYGAPPPQGGYSQPPQYVDRPGSQPAQPHQGDYRPQQYGDRPQYPPQPPQQPQQPYYGSPPPNQINTPPKKSNNGLLYGLIGLVVLLVAGGAIWFFAFNKGTVGPNTPDGPGTSNAAQREAAAANVLPKNTLGYISIATDLSGSQKTAFDNIGKAFESQPGFKEALDRMTRQASGATGGQSDKTVQEVQGLIAKYAKQVSIAMLPPSTSDWQSIQGGGQTAILDVVSRNVVGVAQMDLAQLKTDANSSEVAETYKDVEVSRIVTGSLTFYAAPLDSDNVAVGARAEPIKGMIDQVKDKKANIRDDETYKFLSGAVPADRVASFYINLTDIANQVEAISPGMLSSTGIESLSGAFLLTVSGQNDGIQVDLASQADVKSSMFSQVASVAKPDASTLNDIPSDSMFFYAGTDLKTLIQASLASLKANAQKMGQPDPIAEAEQQVKAMTGLSLENDIIPLLGGDYILSAAAGAGTSMPVSSVVFQMKMNGGDRDKAADAMDKAMQGISRGKATTFDAAGGKFYDLSGLGASGLAAGVGKDRLIVAWNPGGNAPPLVDQVSDNLGKGFGTTPKWDEAKKNLPKDSNAILYVDVENIKTIFAGNLPPDAEPFLKPFKYVLIGSAVQVGPGSSTPNRSLSRIFFGISK
ncbi:MAG TPA: DUF3352 domain-containing protein [Chloroflexia bacterium]|nr:DUF3352 domain-containing protein [Chloroflexia bacterium]